ncbi:unnamed protein product [Echinostoma caproni]|uniref:MFS domain-containing protein n=1 Tax=Echinostoma caproni TaxID=27848 RepID=A0A183ATJ5_9TREM|nr:unnamed protein product [Echinostoma caproni]
MQAEQGRSVNQTRFKMSETEPENFETILKHIYGKAYYIRVIFVFCSMTSLITGLEMQSLIFMHYTPEHNCTDRRIPLNDTTVYWFSERPNIDLSRVNGTQLEAASGFDSREPCWAVFAGSSDEFIQLACSNWTYATRPMQQTVVTQFNLVCERRIWVPWLESVFLLSVAIGFLMASIGDTIGRKKLFLGLALFQIVTSLITPFTHTVEFHLILRCLRGLCPGLAYIGINILSELVPIHRRAAYGNVYWLLFSVGYVTCAGMAYLTRDWVQLRLWMCVFFTGYITFPFILCESPRWLCLQGRPEEATRILKRESEAMRRNLLSDQSNDQRSVRRKDSFLNLFTYRNLRLRLFIFCFVHVAITTAYLGLITNNAFATDNIFLNVVLMGLSEMPSGIAAWLVSEYSGRRLSITLLLALTVVSVGLTELGAFIHPVFRAVMAIGGKFFLSVAYCVIDLYVFEIFPTSTRTSSFFFVNTVASLFGALAPFINNLTRFSQFGPTLIYCAITALGAVLVFALLPETRDCPLAQTLAESERLVRGNERDWSAEMKRNKLELNTIVLPFDFLQPLQLASKISVGISPQTVAPETYCFVSRSFHCSYWRKFKFLVVQSMYFHTHTNTNMCVLP